MFYAGAVNARIIQTRKVFHKNRTTFYSIPLEAGFEKRFGKVYASGRAGVNVTFISTFKGRVVNPEYQVIVDNPGVDLQSALGYYLGLGMGYQINRTLSVFLNGSFEQSPTILINSAEQNYQSFTAQLGIKKFLRR